jgi:protein-L-isoaspartate O-methyltransferase
MLSTTEDFTHAYQTYKNQDLRIYTDPVHGSSGSTVWDAGLCLSKYLEHLFSNNKQDSVATFKNVIEVGCGTGIGGMVLGRISEKSNVTLTDKEPVLKLAKKTLALQPASNISVFPLSWGDIAAGELLLKEVGRFNIVRYTGHASV